MTWTRQFQLGNPSDIYERMEAQAQRQTQKAISKAESPFGDSMGRRIEIPDHIRTAMFQWGDWARRPQFWENLGPTPFYKLLPLPSQHHPTPDTRLDPQSHQIQRAVYRIDSERKRKVLFAYYVVCVAWTDYQSFFLGHGITNQVFIDDIKTGSHDAYKSAMREMKKYSVTI